MRKPAPPSAAPGDHGWDIAFTRMARQLAPPVAACAQGLERRFRGIGLTCDIQSRQTPRGLSTFVALAGSRGLLFIVDITLIDGMAVAGIRGAALEVRLLDACGDAVSDRAAATACDASVYRTCADEVLAAARLARSATSVFVLALGHFDLVPPAWPARSERAHR